MCLPNANQGYISGPPHTFDSADCMAKKGETGNYDFIPNGLYNQVSSSVWEKGKALGALSIVFAVTSDALRGWISSLSFFKLTSANVPLSVLHNISNRGVALLQGSFHGFAYW